MPTYTKGQLLKAIRAQCNECNDVHGGWNEFNDCTGVSCPLYPVRPGNGPGHFEKMKSTRKSNPAAIAALKAHHHYKGLKVRG